MKKIVSRDLSRDLSRDSMGPENVSKVMYKINKIFYLTSIAKEVVAHSS